MKLVVISWVYKFSSTISPESITDISIVRKSRWGWGWEGAGGWSAPLFPHISGRGRQRHSSPHCVIHSPARARVITPCARPRLCPPGDAFLIQPTDFLPSQNTLLRSPRLPSVWCCVRNPQLSVVLTGRYLCRFAKLDTLNLNLSQFDGSYPSRIYFPSVICEQGTISCRTTNNLYSCV